MALVGPRACVLVSEDEARRRCTALLEEVGLTEGLEDDGRLHLQELKRFADTPTGGFAIAALTHFEVPPHIPTLHLNLSPTLNPNPPLSRSPPTWLRRSKWACNTSACAALAAAASWRPS